MNSSGRRRLIALTTTLTTVLSAAAGDYAQPAAPSLVDYTDICRSSAAIDCGQFEFCCEAHCYQRPVASLTCADEVLVDDDAEPPTTSAPMEEMTWQCQCESQLDDDATRDDRRRRRITVALAVFTSLFIVVTYAGFK